MIQESLKEGPKVTSVQEPGNGSPRGFPGRDRLYLHLLHFHDAVRYALHLPRRELYQEVP